MGKTDLEIRVAIITAILQRPVDGRLDTYYMIREAESALKWVMEDDVED